MPVARKDLRRITKRKATPRLKNAPQPTAQTAQLPTPPPPQPQQPVYIEDDNAVEMLLATLTGETPVNYWEPAPVAAATRPTQVNYYTYQEQPQPAVAAPATIKRAPQTQVNYYTKQDPPARPPQQPRLLLRQAYKLASEACMVVGLEAEGEYNATIRLANGKEHLTLTFEDLLCLRGSAVASAVKKYFEDYELFLPLYLDSILVESKPNGGGVVFTNYSLPANPSAQDYTLDRRSSSLILRYEGWTSLEKSFDCIESYFLICLHCAPSVKSLVARYINYLTSYYRRRLIPTTQVNAETIEFVSTELPQFMRELNISRIPPQTPVDSDAARLFMMPWIDAEVRRYCTNNIVKNVINDLRSVNY